MTTLARTSRLHWETNLFISLYSLIKDGGEYDSLLKELAFDLKNLYVVPGSNPSSRNELETKKLKISGEEVYNLNDDFILMALELSSELKIDELIAGELLIRSEHYKQEYSTSLLDSARILYYKRIESIIYIVSYIVATKRHKDIEIVFGGTGNQDWVITNVIGSFKHIETELENIHENIREMKILQPSVIGTVEFQTKLKFRRNNLAKFHGLLGELTFGLSLNNGFLDKSNFQVIYERLAEFECNDVFVYNYLIGLFNYVLVINTTQAHEARVIELFGYFNAQLQDEATLVKNPAKLTVMFFFYTFMSNWLQEAWFSEEQQQANFNKYFSAIQVATLKLIKVGVLEQLMIVLAEISQDYQFSHVLFYDYQVLLQNHIPKPLPLLLLDVDEAKSKQLISLINTNGSGSSLRGYPKIYQEHNLNLGYSSGFKAIVYFIFDEFIRDFLNNFSDILIRICDSEEDYYLTSQASIEELIENADLERFYLVVYNQYLNRKVSWNKLVEFLDWGITKVTNSLIKLYFLNMLSGLAIENSTNVYEYLESNEESDKTNWKSILNVLKKYDIIFEKNWKNKTSNIGELYEISEEEIIELSSYFKVIYGCCINNKQVKQKFTGELLTVLFSLLDNLTSNISIKITFGYEYQNESNLIGFVLNVLSSLVVSENKYEIWNRLDQWIFKNKLNKDNGNFKQFFNNILLNFNNVLGFANLVETLMAAEDSGEYYYDTSSGAKLSLVYPIRLGSAYRKPGVAPYFDYLFNDILINLNNDNLDKAKRQELVAKILNIGLISFKYFNPLLVANFTNAGIVNIDEILDVPIDSYLIENPASIIMQHFFNEKVIQVIFGILSIGNDEICDKDPDDHQVKLVGLTLKIMVYISKFNDVYLDIIIPKVREQGSNIDSSSPWLDVLMNNLAIIGHLGLYLDSHIIDIAKNSLTILSEFSDSHAGKLLVTFETIDERDRIIFGVINQFELTSENLADVSGILALKFDIISFINNNLQLSNNASISHFLLGFSHDLKINLKSLLGSLLNTLDMILDERQIASTNVNLTPIKLSSSILTILNKLLKNPNTCDELLKYINHDFNDLIEKLIRFEPVVNLDINRFSKRKYRDFQEVSYGTLLFFFTNRNQLLQFLSINISTQRYLNFDALIKDGNGLVSNNKLFQLLDVMEFDFFARISEPGELGQQFSGVKFNKIDRLSITNKVSTEGTGEASAYDLTQLNYVMNLALKKTPSQPRDEKEVDTAKQRIVSYIITENNRKNLQSLQFQVLHSWVQLIEIILYNRKVHHKDKLKFIIKCFELILVKISYYFNSSADYCKELVELSVLLLNEYVKLTGPQAEAAQKPGSSQAVVKTASGRLDNLVQTCIDGLLNRNVNHEIRSSLYVIINKYLNNVNDNIVKHLDPKILHIIVKDIENGSSLNRLDAIVLLESLSKNNASVINYLINNETIALLISFIKRTDELLTSGSSINISITLLLYELTIFKAAVYLLIRIGETKIGASHLVDNGLLNVFKHSTLLQLDPELGLHIELQKFVQRNETLTVVNLSLDESLTGPASKFSLVELFIPIYQLITLLLITIGSNNKDVIENVKDILEIDHKLFVGVLKREKLDKIAGKKPDHALTKLCDLFVLLSVLTGYNDRPRASI